MNRFAFGYLSSGTSTYLLSARKKIKELVNSDLEKIEISTVIQAANSGDQFAISIFSDVGHWLGRGIAYLLQIFNPELIIIGGHVAEANQFILAPIQQATGPPPKQHHQ